MKTLQTPSDVLSAINTIETSYSYEPERWMPSYEALRPLEHEMRAQLKPYAWIGTLFLVIGVITFIAFIILLFSRPFLLINDVVLIDNVLLEAALYSTLASAPGVVIWFGSWLMIRVAARRHPLLIYKSRVEAATRRYQPQALKRAANLDANA